MNRYGTEIASVERDVAEITNMELIGVEWDGRNSLAWIWWWTTSSPSPSAAHPTAGVALPPPVDAALSSTDDASHTLSLSPTDGDGWWENEFGVGRGTTTTSSGTE
ncbi:Os12g0289301 [Oryza sativa Japonica Group]|uniref:Os12g0289301 protein n=2 Tax=Oryza sativa subsp. japonica TaxID=39947 RepID=Q2QTM3_ORYSJ|nr:hypothetical protein LOC_Os12g19170 [Oryza sativa Japonica Group]EAZ20205.1 hypothetical protein OsJ_35803 [Oryza sativa Japonica Group]BAT16768.1 Os12g0289301 [Oryza sativa Japonica Group]